MPVTMKNTSTDGLKRKKTVKGEALAAKIDAAAVERQKRSVENELRDRLPTSLASTSNVGLSRMVRFGDDVSNFALFSDEEPEAAVDDQNDEDYNPSQKQKQKRRGTVMFLPDVGLL